MPVHAMAMYDTNTNLNSTVVMKHWQAVIVNDLNIVLQ